MRPGPAPPPLLLLLVAATLSPRPGADASAASAAPDRLPPWPTPSGRAVTDHNLKFTSAFSRNHIDDEPSAEAGDAGFLASTTVETAAEDRKEGNLTVGDLKVELVAKKNITLGYLPAVTGDMKERQGLAVSGAIKMAIDEINKDPYVLPNVMLELRWFDTKGDTVLATKAMTDMLCDGVAAFFGPEGSCHVEAIVAQSRNIPMISYKCSDYKASQVPTFARTEPPETQVTKSIVSLLEYYKWHKFSVIYEEPWKTVAESLFVQAKAKNMTINYRKQAKDRHKCCEDNLKCCQVGYWYEFIQDTKNRTRIYVFLGNAVSLVDLMNTMQTAQLFEKGEYIVLYVDMDNFLDKQARKYLFKLDVFDKYKKCSELSDYDAFVKRAKSLFVVIPTAPTDNYEDFTKRVREYNEKEPFNFHVSHILNSFQRFVPIYAAYLFDSVKLYAFGLDYLIKHANVSVLTDEVLTDIINNGTKIIETIIQINQTYRSVSGAMMKLDKNGDSEGNFSVLAYRPTETEAVVHKNFTCKFRMAPVGQFFQSDDLEFPEYKLNLDTPIQWAGGAKPNDEPSCGFSNELCPKPNTHLNSVVVAGVLAIVLFCAAVITVSIYRKWKIEQEIEGLLWKVNRDDVHFFGGYDNMISSPSRLSLASASVTSYESRGGVQMFATVAQYRGVMVRVKELNFSRKKDISRDVMKEMRLLREIRHDNVNSFIGACVQPMSLLLLTDYCAKGSLYDIIENEDIKLDKMFVASLVHDLLKGMLYIHYSMLGVHGNLKSSNCVVTSRWVLQVTDFGLAEMRHCAENDNSIGEHQYYRSLFWKAPEILRNPNLYLRGTQKGDVYAFAIILYEILGRRGPFGPTGYEPKDIIELVKKEPLDGDEPFRPDVEILFDADIGCEDYVLQVMQDCWAENPEARPDFSTVRSKLKRLKDGTNKNIMDQMMDMMVTYANNLEDLVNERTLLLHEEKNKTEDLLHRMLPKPVAERLTKGYGVEPESFDSVTIYFSDIVGFTAMSAESSPLQVVNFLNDLYTVFDKIIKGYDVYKVETIGDAYMVVSGLPIKNGDRHAGEIASMALDLLAAVNRPNETLKLRIGIHTGPVVAGVVGLTMPRYCLFGDTVNTSSRMESNGEPLKIHISAQCKDALLKVGGYVIKERGVVHMKGKGDVQTFWLLGATENAVQRRDVDLGELPPLFCRPRRSPKLCNESRQPSVCGGFGGINSRRHSSVPRGTSVEVESSSTLQNQSPAPSRHLLKVNRHNLHVPEAGGSARVAPAFISGAVDALRLLESLDAPRWGARPVRVLSSIGGSSTDEQTRSQPALNRIRESKSLDPLPLSKHRPVDPLGTYLHLDFGFPRRSTKSLENCDKCGDIQIIAIPEDKVLNNNFPNGTLVGAAPEDLGDGGIAAEDARAPLLDATAQHPAKVRRRGGSAVDDVPENDISKRWRSLDPLPPSCDSFSDVQNKKVTPRASLKNWLVGIFNPNGLKSSNTSLRKGVLNDYNNLQSEKESVV